MTSEQRARQQIDVLLQQCGWIVQDRSQRNLAAGPGVAIREALLKGGEADYLLFANGKAIATVEAKPEGYALGVFRPGKSMQHQDYLEFRVIHLGNTMIEVEAQVAVNQLGTKSFHDGCI